MQNQCRDPHSRNSMGLCLWQAERDSRIEGWEDKRSTLDHRIYYKVSYDEPNLERYEQDVLLDSKSTYKAKQIFVVSGCKSKLCDFELTGSELGLLVM